MKNLQNENDAKLLITENENESLKVEIQDIQVDYKSKNDIQLQQLNENKDK